MRLGGGVIVKCKLGDLSRDIIGRKVDQYAYALETGFLCVTVLLKFC